MAYFTRHKTQIYAQTKGICLIKNINKLNLHLKS